MSAQLEAVDQMFFGIQHKALEQLTELDAPSIVLTFHPKEGARIVSDKVRNLSPKAKMFLVSALKCYLDNPVGK